MSQDNQFQQYGYDQFLKAPKKQRLGAVGASGGGVWEGIIEKLRSPVIATVALLATGALFTGIIIMAYPSGKNEQAEIPIIRADLSPIKSEPDEPGGMQVPFSESTVLSGLGQDKPDESGNRIENLLAQANQDLTTKEEALQRAMGEEYGAALSASPSSSEEILSTEASPQERGMYLSENAASSTPEVIASEPDSSGLLQKIDPAQAQDISAESSEKIIETASGTKPIMHAAATSPETIDFVRSALNDSADSSAAAPAEAITTQSTQALQPRAFENEAIPSEEADSQYQAVQEEAIEQAEVEPAAGAASSSDALKIEPGAFFVQLASITDRSRADKEFAKLQKKFSVLSGLDYRVQEANLDKGTFFRIQAGPFSKQSAKSICDSIRAQKPGGCILVK